MVKLGDKVRDPITGIEGIAYSCITFMTGCDRIGIQEPVIRKKGEVAIVPELYYVDEPQLVVVTKTKKKRVATDAGGPSGFGPSHKR